MLTREQNGSRRSLKQSGTSKAEALRFDFPTYQQLRVVDEVYCREMGETLSQEKPALTLITGDSLKVLRNLPGDFFQTCVTSPPYWSLRDYNIPGQIGLEGSIEEYTGTLATYLNKFIEFCDEMAPCG